MLNGTNKPSELNVIMLNVIILSVIILNVVIWSIICWVSRRVKITLAFLTKAKITRIIDFIEWSSPRQFIHEKLGETESLYYKTFYGRNSSKIVIIYIVRHSAIYTITWLQSKGKLLALTANIRLGWRWRTVTNTLAYCSKELNTSVKKFYSRDQETISYWGFQWLSLSSHFYS
jgi:hypothetical protein